MGFLAPGAVPGRETGSLNGRAEQLPGRVRPIRDEHLEGLCRSRFPARPIAGGLGHPRRPRRRPRGRSLPDGRHGVAVITAREGKAPAQLEFRL